MTPPVRPRYDPETKQAIEEVLAKWRDRFIAGEITESQFKAHLHSAGYRGEVLRAELHLAIAEKGRGHHVS